MIKNTLVANNTVNAVNTYFKLLLIKSSAPHNKKAIIKEENPESVDRVKAITTSA
jgi:hypothetical protein